MEVKKYQEYCAPCKIHIMAALKFNERRQADSESFDSFVTDLKILVKDCGYQEEERMVRDAIVFRCKHSKVREKCLDLADELTLKKAVKIGCTHETNLDSLKKLAKDEDPTVNVVEKRQTQSRRYCSHQDAEKQASEEKEKTDRTKDNCRRCEYNKTHRQCPAMGQQCSFCKNMNHYSKLRRSRQVHHLQEEGDSQNSSDDLGDCGDESSLFVYAVESNSLAEDEQFHETVELEGTQVKFQLDSGAKANVISLKTYKSLKCRPLPPLRKTRTVLVSFLKHKLKPRREVALTTRYKDQVENVKFFVVNTEVESVLSGNSCLKLGLLTRVYQLTGQELPSKQVELLDYPEWFTGLGCLPATYHGASRRSCACSPCPKEGTRATGSESCRRTKTDGKARSNSAPGGTD